MRLLRKYDKQYDKMILLLINRWLIDSQANLLTKLELRTIIGLVGGQRVMTMSTAKLVPQPSVVDLRKFALLKFQHRMYIFMYIKYTFGVYVQTSVHVESGDCTRPSCRGANCIPTITVVDIILISFP